MAPRTKKQGAAAKAGRTSRKGGSRAASSSRTSAAPKRKSVKSSGRKNSSPARGRGPAARPMPWWSFPAAAVIVMVLFAWTYYPVARVQYRETREKQRLEAELESLQARNDRLRKQVDRLRTPEGVEDYARSQLGLVKQGENAVVVVDEGNPKPSAPSSATPDIDSDRMDEGPVGPWTAFLDLVFGLR
jgi:cell division protein FtsL